MTNTVKTAEGTGLSDTQIIENLQEGADAADVFAATREWSLEKMRLSIQSRGDFFDRQGAIVFELDGREVLHAYVNSLPITIGSDEKTDCRLPHEGISRVHCRLESVGNLVRLCDNGSKNGTYLNGKSIDFEDLCDGDEIKLGSVSMRVKRT